MLRFIFFNFADLFSKIITSTYIGLLGIFSKGELLEVIQGLSLLYPPSDSLIEPSELGP